MSERRTRRWPLLLPLLFGFLAATPAAAQYLRRYNTTELLGTLTVYHIVRDRNDFLWFCTDRGLARWDGTTVQHFGREQGLPDDVVFNAYEDKAGRMWAFTFNGQYSCIVNGQVQSAANTAALAGLPPSGSFLTCMAQADDSTLYMSFASHAVLQIGAKGAVWLAKGGNKTGGVLIRSDRLAYSPAVLPGFVRIDDRRGIRLEADRSGIAVYRAGARVWSLQDGTLNENFVLDMCMPDDRHLVACTRNGLELFDLLTGSRTHCLDGVKISGCCPDMDGNIWLSTLESGIVFLHRELQSIAELKGPEGLRLHAIDSAGLLYLRDNCLYELAQVPEGPPSTRLLCRGIRNDWRPVYRGAGNIAFSDPGNFTLRVCGVGGTRQTAYPYPFRRVFNCGNGRFVGCAFDGLIDGSMQDGHLVVRKTIELHKRISADCRDDASGALLVCSGSRIYRFWPHTGQFDLLVDDRRLSGINAMAVWEDDLLMTSGAREFYRLNLRTGGAAVRPVKAAAAVYSFALLPDPSRILVAAGQGGYALMDRDGRLNPLSYPFASGSIEDMEVKGSTCFIRNSGRWYAFNAGLLNKRQPESRFYLKEVLLNGRPVSSAGADLHNVLEAVVQIRLGRLDFSRSLPVLRYRLLGEQPGEWRSTDATNLEVVLTGAGLHTIELALAGSDRGGETLRIPIYLHRPFTRSAPFYALIGLLLAAVATAAVLVLIRRRKRIHLREMNYLKLEHKAINALLNPHFVFNSISNIQNLVLNTDRSEASRYLTVLSRLIRQNLENLQRSLIPLQDELSLIERYVQLQNLRYSGNIRLDIRSDAPGLLTAGVPPLLVHTFVENAIVHGYRDRHKTFCITVHISRPNAELLRITVTDNGVGLAAVRKKMGPPSKSSLGISFNRSRLERLSRFYGLDQSIVLEPPGGNGSGTRVVIQISVRLFELVGTDA